MPEFEDEAPSEFEPDRESVERAESLTSGLLEGLRIVTAEGPHPGILSEVFSQSRYAERAEGVPVADVVDNVAEMAAQFAIQRRWGNEVLCLRMNGEIAPISVVGTSGGPPDDLRNFFFRFLEREIPFIYPRSVIRDMFNEYKRSDEQLLLTSIDEATEASKRNIGGFLAYRFAGMKLWNDAIQRFQKFSSGPPTASQPSAVGSGGGLQIQVSCSTPGLRIHISPQFFVNWVVFGSPSSPVTSYVLPGRYIFAGDGPMMPKRKRDNGVFRIPPTYNPVLTRF